MKLGVVPKFSSPDALRLAEKILRYSESKGMEAYLDWRASKLIKWVRRFSIGRDEVDFIVVVGGDGTILDTLHKLGDRETPIATIKYGRRGFLADVSPLEYRTAIDRLAEGRYFVERYMRLAAEVRGEKLPYVLNEFVIAPEAAHYKVVRLRVYRQNELIYYLVGDGVVVSTPTGSTAYNLAAGGPVVDPRMDAIIVTPLAPITFCSRSVVLPPTTEVRVVVNPPANAVLIGDGAFSVRLQPDESVVFRRAPRPAIFVRFYISEFFERLFQRCM